MDDRYLYAGLIRLHLLHHAVKEPIYGLAMIEELGRHGYKLSAGTLYPILHGFEEKGYLSSTEERTGSAARQIYRATPTQHFETDDFLAPHGLPGGALPPGSLAAGGTSRRSPRPSPPRLRSRVARWW